MWCYHCSFCYSCCPEPFPDVTFWFHLRRRTTYYTFNIIIPCVMLSLLTLGSFVLPAESGEKVSLGLTVLLAFSVFMLLIAESMPATSEFVPLIGMYSLPYRQHRSLTHSLFSRSNSQGTRRCESTSMTLIQHHNKVLCSVCIHSHTGSFIRSLTHSQTHIEIPNYNCHCMWFSVSNIVANQLSQHL